MFGGVGESDEKIGCSYIILQFDEEVLMKLFFCIIIDLIGMATYLVPGFGELGDIAWAPIQTGLIRLITGHSDGWTKLAFWEEILPGTDFIPSATINYFVHKK